MKKVLLSVTCVIACAMLPFAATAQVAGPPAGTAGMRELSPWSMFMSADILVKAVMVSLAFASLVTWTIFLGKTVTTAFASFDPPVTRGVRVASFFWLQSMVRDAHARSMIFDLDSAIQALVERLGRDDPETVKLTGIYHNLIRHWAEV